MGRRFVRISVSSRFASRAFTVSVGAVLSLVLLSFISHSAEHLDSGGPFSSVVSAYDQGGAGIPWLGVDEEQSIPAWFSAVALFLCSLLLTSLSGDPRRRAFTLHWRLLAVIFLVLSLDEAVGFHERAIVPLRSAWGVDGLLYFTWVIPAAILVVAVALAYLGFIRALPARTRQLMIVAALLYVGGALVMELFGALQVSRQGQENLTYVVLSTVEELFEMLGIVVFLYALLVLSVPAPSHGRVSEVGDQENAPA